MITNHVKLFHEYFVNEAESPNQALVKTLTTQVETVRTAYNNAAEQFRNNKITSDQLMTAYKTYLLKDNELKVAQLQSKLETAGQNIKKATDEAAKPEKQEAGAAGATAGAVSGATPVAAPK